MANTQLLYDIAIKGDTLIRKTSLDVKYLGTVELTQSVVNGNHVWRGIHGGKVFIICSRKKKLQFDIEEMTGAVWVFSESEQKDSVYSIDCILYSGKRELPAVDIEQDQTRENENLNEVATDGIVSEGVESECLNMTETQLMSHIEAVFEEERQYDHEQAEDIALTDFHRSLSMETAHKSIYTVASQVTSRRLSRVKSNKSTSSYHCRDQLIKASTVESQIYLALLDRHKVLKSSFLSRKFTISQTVYELSAKIRMLVQGQFQYESSELLDNRLKSHEKKYGRQPMFYEFCFELFCTYSLDCGQLCDVLDYFTPSRDIFKEELANIIVEKKDDWLINRKVEWLREMNDNGLSGKNGIVLAKLPWTMKIYRFVLSNAILDSKELDIVKVFSELDQGIVVQAIMVNDGNTKLEEKLETIARKQTLVKSLLLKRVNSIDAMFCLMGSLSEWKYDIIECVTSGKVGRSILESFPMFLPALLCQAFFLGCQSNRIRRFLRTSRVTSSKRHLLQCYQSVILENVFRKDISERTSHSEVEQQIQDIFPNDEHSRNILNLEHIVFVCLLDVLQKRKHFRESESYEQDILEEFKDQAKTNGYPEFQKLMEFTDKKENDLFRKFIDITDAFMRMKRVTQDKFLFRDAQVLAVLYLILHKDSKNKGVLCKIFTGEGKSCLVAIVAGYWGLQKKKVDVITSSRELSVPEKNSFQHFYSELGLKVGALENNEGINFLRECDVVYGTVSSFVREKLKNDGRNSFQREHDVVIVDEVDNMLFDRSSTMIQLSSPHSVALMPILYPILLSIYFDAVAAYRQFGEKFENNFLSVQEKHERVIEYIKDSFRHNEQRTSPTERLNSIKSSALHEDLFPEMDLVKPTDSQPCIIDVIQDAQLVLIPKLSVNVSMKDLRHAIELLFEESQVFSLHYGRVYHKHRKACICFEDPLRAVRLIELGSIEVDGNFLKVTNIQLSKNRFTKSNFTSRKRILKDCRKSYELALQLDSEERFLTFGVLEFLKLREHVVNPDDESYVNKIGQQSKEPHKILDDIIGYLRYVHRYCYYSQKYFHDRGDMMMRGLNRKVRGNKNYKSGKQNISTTQFDMFVEHFSRSPEWVQQRKADRYLNQLRLKARYGDMIQALPIQQRLYCLLHFNTWIENCYHAIFFIQKNISYVQEKETNVVVKIDNKNTGVLQPNTHLGGGIEQFIGMKENTSIPIPIIVSSFHGIAQYFNKYDMILGVSGTLGNQDTREFLTTVYDVSIVDIPSHYHDRMVNTERIEAKLSNFYLKQENEELEDHERFYRCFEFPPLVLRNRTEWINVVCESTQYQIVLNRPVLVFCKNLFVVSEIENHLKERFQKVHLQCDVIRYDALNKLKLRNFADPVVILATNIAGRGTNFLFSHSVYRAGGLHVCLTFVPISKRVELQCVGRTARQGEMGSAQMIIHDDSHRTIEQLRKSRDEANMSRIQEARDITEKYNFVQNLANEFNDFLCDHSLDFEVWKRDESHAKRLNEIWQQHYIHLFMDTEAEVSIKLEKERLLRKYVERHGKVSDRVKSYFLSGTNLVYKDEAYDSACMDNLRQKWGYWLSEHCFSDTMFEPNLLASEFKIFLAEFQDSHTDSFAHFVFVAKEAFLLLKEEICTTTMEKLQVLFSKSGLEAMIYNSTDITSNYRDFSEMPYRSKRYCGVALYYFAVFKFERMIFKKLSIREHLAEVRKVLYISEHHIANEIISLYEHIESLLANQGPVYQEINAVLNIFKGLQENILGLVAEITDILKSENINIHCNECNTMKISVDNFASNGMNHQRSFVGNIIKHCTSFGYFGYFAFQYQKSSLNDLIEKTSKSFTLMPNLKGIISIFANLYSFLGVSQHEPKSLLDDVRQEYDKMKSVAISKDLALNFMQFLNQESYINNSICRDLTLNRIVQHGISSSNYIQDEVIRSVQEKDLERCLRVKQDFENELKKLSDICSTEILEFFVRKKIRRLYMPTFLIDVYNDNVLKASSLMKRFNHVMTKYDSQILHRVKEPMNEDRTVLLASDYVEKVHNSLKGVLEQDSFEWDVYIEIMEGTEGLEKPAEKRFEKFAMQVVQRLLTYITRSIQKKYERKDPFIRAVEKVEAIRMESVDYSSNCPCCSSLPKQEALQMIAHAFGVILVVYKEGRRLDTFCPEHPTGFEQISYYHSLDSGDEAELMWIVRQEQGFCLIDLLKLYYKYRDISNLLEANTVSSKRRNTKIKDNLAEYENLGTAWYVLQDVQQLNEFGYGAIDYASLVLEEEHKPILRGLHASNSNSCID